MKRRRFLAVMGAALAVMIVARRMGRGDGRDVAAQRLYESRFPLTIPFELAAGGLARTAPEPRWVMWLPMVRR